MEFGLALCRPLRGLDQLLRLIHGLAPEATSCRAFGATVSPFYPFTLFPSSGSGSVSSKMSNKLQLS